MSWINVTEDMPIDEQWCWVFIPDQMIVCACYDRKSQEWYIPGLDFNCSAAIPTHWQPYFTPAPPDCQSEISDWSRKEHDL